MSTWLASVIPGSRPPPMRCFSLHEAHVRTIPFENVDVLLGSHRGLGLDAITDKLVRRRRGGYCFEHALLFAAVAQQLGYQVTRLISRVQPHRAGPRTHMSLKVRAEGVDHLVDVGFGSGLLTAMPLRDGVVVDQAGWKHRLTRDGRRWTLAKQTKQGWEPQHLFDEEDEQRPIDYQVAHHYVSTHPGSPFTHQLIVIRLEPGLRRQLIGGTLTEEHADGRLVETPIPLEALEDTLRLLDVVLDRGEMAELRAWMAQHQEPDSAA
ncbi:MAG TPA: arylamine N-acetyltransferase [Pseudonocardia sp.]|uniref:arylamine N-acetyltransferase family protein n=1 Tax=Pseudonocardia sp. TaxID=60912 RepID=UPI002ED95806